MDYPIAHAHDIFVRTIMSDLSTAREFFEDHLPPAILQTINLDTIELQPTSFINDIRQESTMDLLYKVKQIDPVGVMYLLLEHQSTPDPYMALRIRKYIDNVIDFHMKNSEDKRIPMVYAFVLYHGRHPYPYSTDIHNLVNANINMVQQHFGGCRLIDLALLTDNEINKNSRIGLAKYVLKHIFDSDLLPYIIEIIDNLQMIAKSGYGNYVSIVLQYIIERGEIGDVKSFYHLITSHLSNDAGEPIMTIAELLRNEGLQEGLHKGIHQGQYEEKLATAKRLLAARAEPAFVSRITDLPLETILSLEIHSDS